MDIVSLTPVGSNRIYRRQDAVGAAGLVKDHLQWQELREMELTPEMSCEASLVILCWLLVWRLGLNLLQMALVRCPGWKRSKYFSYNSAGER